MKYWVLARAVFGVAVVGTSLHGGVAHASVQGRGLNGDTVVDALHDTDLDIRWLRNANVNGPMTWMDAKSWIHTFSVDGLGRWRLPTSDACRDSNCTGSEMGRLWYVELGDAAGWMTSWGDFQNALFDRYWSGTQNLSDLSRAWYFEMYGGAQNFRLKSDPLYAMAVHAGDVGVVPDPATAASMLVGSGVVGFIAGLRNDSRSSEAMIPAAQP